MAKRYRKKGNNKKFLRFLIFLVIIFIIVYGIYYFFVKKDNSKEVIMDNTQLTSDNILNNTEDNVKYEKTDNEDNKSQNDSGNENVSLSSDVLIPKDLDNEVRNNFESKLKDSDIVRIHYKLKSLEEGTVQLYYKLNKTKLYLLQVDISSKKIIEAEEVEDKELLKKSAIVNYLNENIKQDFDEYKNELNAEDSRLNIIISNTEIVINVSYES